MEETAVTFTGARLIQIIALALGVVVACSDPRPAPGERAELAPRPTSQTAADRPQPRQDTLRLQSSDAIGASRSSAIVRAAERVSSAVVSVNVVRRQVQRTSSGLFDFFFMPREYERLVQGVASGFIVSDDGLVITNQHVTDGAQEIVVTTRDGADYDAELLGGDPLTDIAVLRIDAGSLPTTPIGSSQDLMIGEWVVAIGNPFAYLLGNAEPTVTAGVISAVGRNILPSGDQQGIYVGMIQTDAAINPGNSGGPLVNALGEVVGVNSSIFTQSGGSIGIGFAIPIERAMRVAQELRRHGAVRRAWVGLDVTGAEDLRAWKKVGGLSVTHVAPESPAAEAGLRANDVLLSADGRPLRTFLDWEAAKLDIGPGDAVKVAFRRGGREREVRLTVGSLPTTRAERIAVLGDIELITVTPQIRQERGLERESGALIFSIGPQAARSTGLRAGDVILQINNRRIQEAEDARAIIRTTAGRAAIRVFFERNGRVRITDFYVR